MSQIRMKAILALAALSSLALPMAAQASTSRVEGMALQGDYIKDETGIYTYTNEVANVGSFIYGEMGNWQGALATPNDRAVGAVLGNLFDGRYGAWGIHMRETTPQLGQGDATSSPSPTMPGGTLAGFSGSDPNTNGWQSFDLQWGKKFGTKSLGLHMNRSFGKEEGDHGALGNLSIFKGDWGSTPIAGGLATNTFRNIFGLGGGFGWEMGTNSNAEVSVLWESRTYEIKDTLGVDLFKDDGPTTWQVAGRMFWQWQPNVMVVPVFKYTKYDLSDKTPAASFDNSITAWQAGAAGNWTLGSNDLFVLGLTFAQNKLDQQRDVFGLGFTRGTVTETFTPEIFAALETHVNPWLTLRFGADKGAWHSVKEDDTATPLNHRWENSPFFMTLGAGIKLGTLQLDAVLNDHIAQNGLYLLSGSANTPLASKVTATYAF
jgi:hypothetical protein